MLSGAGLISLMFFFLVNKQVYLLKLKITKDKQLLLIYRFNLSFTILILSNLKKNNFNLENVL